MTAGLQLPAEGCAPAKLILSGEHSVVYGHPAVAVAVDRSTRVTLRALDDPEAPTLVTSAATAVVPTLRDALTRVVPEVGLHIGTQSDIPIGRGMGSSASLAVALVRAWCAARGVDATHDTVSEGAFEVERVFHGTPSGVDHGVIQRGGAVRFQRASAGITLTPLRCGHLPLVVLDSGVAGNTLELVAGVRARRDALRTTLDAMGRLTEQVVAELHGAAAQPESARLVPLGALLTENHALLRTLGVSTPHLDHLVDFALQHGALGAKLSGAGGGGVVVALAPDPQPLLTAARRAGHAAFAVQVIASGDH